jgi:hypothetical protein
VSAECFPARQDKSDWPAECLNLSQDRASSSRLACRVIDMRLVQGVRLLQAVREALKQKSFFTLTPGLKGA